MIDHVTIPVADVKAARRFYDAALAPLGLPFLMSDGSAAGYGVDAWRFGIAPSDVAGPPIHVAFTAPSRAAVDAFHKAALEAGGVNNGEPGLRPAYGEGYYAAFVLDPDGANVEAVFRG